MLEYDAILEKMLVLMQFLKLVATSGLVGK